jgi:protein ImuA
MVAANTVCAYSILVDISPALSADPGALAHPALWRAYQLGRAGTAAVPSGFDDLDFHLPGGGWPLQALTELLLPHAGLGELRLLAPALAAVQRQQRSLMWFDPPAAPCAWALSALGIDMRQLVVVNSRQPLKGRARERLPAADVLWALEQALKSGHVGAVLAWLPARLPADALRRLQLAAQGHDGPAFLLRDTALRTQPSPAPLRLLLASAGPDLLRVAVLKRRGPPLAQPLTLALPPVLSAPALARARRPVPAQATADGLPSRALSP